MKEFHVISHTHWDREWYQPFEQFRLRLVDLMDNLLDIFEKEPDYVFHLDAQTICLEDYLEIRPHKRARVEELVRERRLLVGPWYVQNDFYLTSGEATIRNLLVGSQIAKSFGHCSKTGYVPDQFGLMGQLPQIFGGFGIKDCIFGRGYNVYKLDRDGRRLSVSTPNEFVWQSPDGSSVLAVLMRNWYNNAQRFSKDPSTAARCLELIDEGLEETSTTPYRLLMNGVDHLEAQENLLPILDKLNASLEKDRIFQSTMPQYLRKVRAYLKGKTMRRVKGELRKGVNRQILQGTLSSRPYLKTANAQAQSLLELQVEPLWAALGLMTNEKTTFPQDELRYAWKMLLKNHPHDSICGCSRDEVHRDNEQRFKRVAEIGRELLRRGLVQLASRIDRAGLKGAPYFAVVANTLPTERSETVMVRLYLPCEDGIRKFELRDDRGRAVEFDVVEDRVRNRMTASPINLPGQIECRELLIRLHADNVPACGYRVYTVSPCKGTLGTPRPVKQPMRVVLENAYLKVTVGTSGKINMVDKRTGIATKDVLAITDEADVGDSYNFIAASGDEPIDISCDLPTVTLLEGTRLCQSVELAWSPKLPAAYDVRKKRRSARCVRNRISLRLTLRKAGRQLEVDAAVDNRSKDHRLRLLVNSRVQSDFSFAAAPFEVVKRDRRELLAGIRDDGTQPNSGMVAIHDRERAMAVLNEGVYEYEHLLNRRGTLAFTLLRATGLISSGGAGIPDVGETIAPEWQCPENQCLREVHLRLAIVPGIRKLAELEQMRVAFLSPILATFAAADPHTFSGGRVCVQDSQVSELFYRDLPEAEVCLSLRGSALRLKGSTIFSALKRAERGKGYVVRSYNPSGRSVKQELAAPNVKSVTELAMDESVKGPVGTVTEVDPCGILSLGLKRV